MITQQQINDKAAQKTAAKTRMSDSDAEALAYIKSLPAWREAYPVKAAEYDAAKEDYRTARAELAVLEAAKAEQDAAEAGEGLSDD